MGVLLIILLILSAAMPWIGLPLLFLFLMASVPIILIGSIFDDDDGKKEGARKQNKKTGQQAGQQIVGAVRNMHDDTENKINKK